MAVELDPRSSKTPDNTLINAHPALEFFFNEDEFPWEKYTTPDGATVSVIPLALLGHFLIPRPQDYFGFPTAVHSDPIGIDEIKNRIDTIRDQKKHWATRHPEEETEDHREASAVCRDRDS